VKFSLERYKGRRRGPRSRRRVGRRGRSSICSAYAFRLKQPWPDFMTFYGSPANGPRGWIVPKKYIEKVGDDGFKAPIRSAPAPTGS